MTAHSYQPPMPRRACRAALLAAWLACCALPAWAAAPDARCVRGHRSVWRPGHPATLKAATTKQLPTPLEDTLIALALLCLSGAAAIRPDGPGVLST